MVSGSHCLPSSDIIQLLQIMEREGQEADEPKKGEEEALPAAWSAFYTKPMNSKTDSSPFRGVL